MWYTDSEVFLSLAIVSMRQIAFFFHVKVLIAEVISENWA